MPDDKITIFWFRRDLRLDDNHGLFNALSASKNVMPIFIFDKLILDQIADRNDKRVAFIFEALERINQELMKIGSGIEMHYGTPLDVFKLLIQKFNVASVYTNEDYEPYAIKRDREISDFLAENAVEFKSFQDQIIFHPDDILKSDNTPFQVYSPYAKKWMEQLPEQLTIYESEKLKDNFLKFEPQHLEPETIGFAKNEKSYYEPNLSEQLLQEYSRKRNFPAKDGTSKVSTHLRFGTISIRKLVMYARKLSTKFLRELIWREFYTMILYHFPHTVSRAFKPKYDNISWKNNEVDFEKWKTGKTGFPLVDAGIRELNATGYMHNRVRMLTASFLIKDLLIDWRWGEAYFAEKLLDYDLAQNVGNWQWCAGSGCDAAPYFRIFNPELQLEKFDPKLEYVKKWIPEFGTEQYPKPMLDHKSARIEALEVFSNAIQ